MKKLFLVLGGLAAYATLLGVLIARATTVWEVLGYIVAGFFAVAAGVSWLTPLDTRPTASTAPGRRRVDDQPPVSNPFLGRTISDWIKISCLMDRYHITSVAHLEDHIRKAQGLATVQQP